MTLKPPAAGPVVAAVRQDAVIQAVAAANPSIIVVLETGNPVLFHGNREGHRSSVRPVVLGTQLPNHSMQRAA